MGQKDTALKQYLEDETRFADLINGMIGQGKVLIPAEALREKDPRMAESISLRPDDKRKIHTGKYKKILPKYRDLVKKAAFGVNFVVIGMESQDKVHYLMPLRCMGYDVREYERQASGIGKKLLAAVKEKKMKLSESEYLSRFRREYRLHPCITLVLYFGDDWDGATSMRELLDYREIPQELHPYINDYPMHILHVKKLQDTSVFHSDLRLVFDSIRFANDTELFRRKVLQNPEFQDLDDEAYHVIQQYSHSQELERLEQAVQIQDKGGNVNMCRAITELIAEGREEGRKEGRYDLIRAMYRKGLNREMILSISDISEGELAAILKEEKNVIA